MSTAHTHYDPFSRVLHWLTAIAVIAAFILGPEHFGREMHQGLDPATRWDIVTHESLGLLTFCVLVLKNGFTVTGESACASPENFNEELGRKIARANAVNKVWPLEGYLLKQMLHQTALGV